jgi:uncharacterized C2H2 Zn-finger protein
MELADKRELSKHYARRHSLIKPYECDICGFRGAVLDSIHAHMKRHFKDRPVFKCDFEGCDFKSHNKHVTRSHKKKHFETEKPTFPCHCGKVFMSSGGLNSHIIIKHSNVDAIKCEYCGKGFGRKADYSLHVKRSHLERTDQYCHICGKIFKNAKSLEDHMVYHEEPKFPCPIENCPHTYHKANQLKVHLNVHANVREHACHLCDKKYFYSKNLRDHLKKFHNSYNSY